MGKNDYNDNDDQREENTLYKQIESVCVSV